MRTIFICVTNMARAVRYHAGVPVYRYRIAPEVPPVTVLRIGTSHPPVHEDRHIHEFPVLVYVEPARPQTADGSSRAARGGDAYVVAAGENIDPGIVSTVASGYALFFDPAAVGGDPQMPRSSWRAHPLLFPFLHDVPDGLLRLRVPPERESVWAAAIAALGTELTDRAEGYRQAALAHLTILLVDVARLAASAAGAEDAAGASRRTDERLLSEVFDTIERRFTQPLSARDVAASVGMTPGHLTTLVRRRTGRTLGDWIVEWRMAQARRLLTGTDLPIGEVARRVGMPDHAYFARVFRRQNAMTPRAWRQRTKS